METTGNESDFLEANKEGSGPIEVAHGNDECSRATSVVDDNEICETERLAMATAENERDSLEEAQGNADRSRALVSTPVGDDSEIDSASASPDVDRAHCNHSQESDITSEHALNTLDGDSSDQHELELPAEAQEVVVTRGEEGRSEEDCSSLGMGSVVSSSRRHVMWEERVVTPFPLQHLRTSQHLRSWHPSSGRGRSRRWDYPALSDSRLPYTRRLGEPARHTLPAVLHDPVSTERQAPDIEAPTISEEASASSAEELVAADPEDASSKPSEEASKSTTPSPFTVHGSPDSKYETYACVVDSTQEDRAVEIQLASLDRPHMRAFHLAWMSFFVAFFTWFALTPLLSEIARSLNLTKEEIWTSSICGVAGSAVTRILVGPVCDRYGARWAMGGTLFLSAIPMGLTGVVQTGTGLNILRLFIGLAGSAFVSCQAWSMSMFTMEVAATANALAAGWGNLGGGVTQIVMGSVLFPLFKIIYGGEGWTRAETSNENDDIADSYDRASDLAWRTCCFVPALLCLVMTYFVVRRGDDCPKGNYHKRRRQGFMISVSARKAVMAGLSNFNTWILFLQYGCCFGVEITMVNAAALYFKEEFGLSTESAAAIASIFGWMNLFARGFGGFLSDIANSKKGMRGRLWIQVFSLVGEGALVIVFSTTHTLAGAIMVMVVFSCFVQIAEGSTFGIVPYVNPAVAGSVSGIVGAGGNVGGVAFAAIFRSYDYRDAFKGMGWTAMISAIFTFCLSFRGHASLCCGTDAQEVLNRRASHAEGLGRFPTVSMNDQDVSRRSSRRGAEDTDESGRSSRRRTLRRDQDSDESLHLGQLTSDESGRSSRLRQQQDLSGWPRVQPLADEFTREEETSAVLTTSR